MAQTELPRDELSATVEARHELGQELEPHVIDGFLERVGRAIDERVDQRLKQAAPNDGGEGRIGLAVVSLLFGIPLTGIGAGTTGLAGLLVVWTGIVLVNFAYALRR
jgi:hypothetical protein